MPHYVHTTTVSIRSGYGQYCYRYCDAKGIVFGNKGITCPMATLPVRIIVNNDYADGYSRVIRLAWEEVLA